jgi:hypothetical protein
MKSKALANVWVEVSVFRTGLLISPDWEVPLTHLPFWELNYQARYLRWWRETISFRKAPTKFWVQPRITWINQKVFGASRTHSWKHDSTSMYVLTLFSSFVLFHIFIDWACHLLVLQLETYKLSIVPLGIALSFIASVIRTSIKKTALLNLIGNLLMISSSYHCPPLFV